MSFKMQPLLTVATAALLCLQIRLAVACEPSVPAVSGSKCDYTKPPTACTDWVPATVGNLIDVNLNMETATPTVYANWTITDAGCTALHQIICVQTAMGEEICIDDVPMNVTEYQVPVACGSYAISVAVASACGEETSCVEEHHTLVKAFNDPWFTNVSGSNDCGHAVFTLDFEDPCGLVFGYEICWTGSGGSSDCYYTHETDQLEYEIEDFLLTDPNVTVEFKLLFYSPVDGVSNVSMSTELVSSTADAFNDGEYSIDDDTVCFMISSVNFPNEYDLDLNAQYLFNTTSDLVLEIEFLEFDVENVYDLVTLYDGETDGDDVLAELTGKYLPDPPTYTSTGDKMLLVFATDSTKAEMGFLARVYAVPAASID